MMLCRMQRSACPALPLVAVRGQSCSTPIHQCRPVVARCSRCTFSTCGSNFDWMSTAIFADRLHLTPAG